MSPLFPFWPKHYWRNLEQIFSITRTIFDMKYNSSAIFSNYTLFWKLQSGQFVLFRSIVFKTKSFLNLQWWHFLDWAFLILVELWDLESEKARRDSWWSKNILGTLTNIQISCKKFSICLPSYIYRPSGPKM